MKSLFFSFSILFECHSCKRRWGLIIVIAWMLAESWSESRSNTISLSTFLFLYFLSVTHVRDVEKFFCNSLDASSFPIRILSYYGKSFHFSFSILFECHSCKLRWRLLIALKIKTGKSLVNRGVFPVFYFYMFMRVGFLGLCGLLRRRSWRFGWHILIQNR